jgi:cytochrome c peroxidase
MKYSIILFFGITFLLTACGGGGLNQYQDEVVETDSIHAQAVLFFKPLPTVAEPKDYQLTPELISLGKMLFHDTRLSLEGNNSCNSCHDINKFGVDNEPVSDGDKGKAGDRNSPTVFNAALHAMQFWDGRAETVEEQAGMPILNPVEMNIPSEKFLEDRLSKIEEYQQMFASAFPGQEKPITFKNLTTAIAAFERTLITPSRFDHYLEGDYHALTQTEKNGLKVFIKSGCNSCHSGRLLGGNTFQKAGVYADLNKEIGSVKDDKGRMEVTNNPADEYMFKVPSLRNITKTFPYFHNGSVADLKKACEIMARVQLKVELSDKELDDMLAFFESLTGEIPESARSDNDKHILSLR